MSTDLFGQPIPGEITRTARFSGDRVCRYTLERYWSTDPFALFILLNPSTADAVHDDPTNRRGMGFARSWGYGGCVFVNLFAYRTPYPSELTTACNHLGTHYVIGTDNDQVIIEMAKAAGIVICAWGIHGELYHRGQAVLAMLRAAGVALNHMGLTKYGFPKHILYLKSDTKLEAFE